MIGIVYKLETFLADFYLYFCHFFCFLMLDHKYHDFPLDENL